jgi:hypothetical protein
MKSEDRDLETNGIVRLFWIMAYSIAAAGTIYLVITISEEFHHRGLNISTIIHIIPLLLIYICLLILTFRFREHIRYAIRGKLISKSSQQL